MVGKLKYTKGFEALYAASTPSIKSPSDALVCFIHAFLTSHEFACVGVSDVEMRPTELLPQGWSDSQDVYVLRYLNEPEAEAYTLKALVVDGIMTVQLLRKSDDAVTTTNVKISDFTLDAVSDYRGTFKDLRDLEEQLALDVLRPLSGGAAPPPPPNRDPPPDRYTYDPDPLRIGHTGHPARAGGLQPDDPFAVGTGDLDPLNAGVGGGMIMDPFRRGPVRGDPSAGLPPGSRLPPGAVPPGARFDPFGPPGVGPSGMGPGSFGGPSRFGPSPDHMRPPGYDDMFM